MTRLFSGKHLLRTFACCAAISIVPSLAAQRVSASGAGNSVRFAYAFSCAGQYMRIDLANGKHTAPHPVPGIAAGSGGFDGCLLHDLQSAPGVPVVYGIMPLTRTVDQFGNRQEQVVAFDLPGLHLLNSAPLPGASARPAKLRLDAAAAELTVEYRATGENIRPHSENLVFGMDSSAQLKALTSGSRSPAAPAMPFPSRNTYIDETGKVVDRNRVMSPDGRITVITGYELLTDSLRERFRDLQHPDAAGNPYLDISFVASAAGRMVFIVDWDTRERPSNGSGGVVVYDAIQGKVLSSFAVPYRTAGLELAPGTPNVHLTPDGRRVLVEDYAWKTGSDGASRFRSKSGILGLYDASSGALLRTISLSAGPGESGRVVAFSPDASYMYYACTGRIYVVDLLNQGMQFVPAPNGFLPTEVITADR